MRLGLSSLWRWVALFAVLAGLAQSLLVFVVRLTNNRLIPFSEDGIWMAPVANIALFGLAAAGLYAATRRMTRSTAIAVAWAAFVFLGGLGPALLTRKLHPAASLALLAGVAIQSARLVRPRAELVDALIRRSLPATLVVTVLVGLAQYGFREAQANSGPAGLPGPSAEAPNVIVIVLDTVRAANLSLYGYERPTSPHLNEFARSGVVFERALATSSWTLPSHAAMFTGRLPNEVTADWLTPLDDAHRTLAEVFSERGYNTVGIVANLIYATKASGLARGFQRYTDFPRTPETIAQHSWLVRPLVNRVREAMGDSSELVRKHAATVTDQYLDWLDSGRSGKPFFAFLNYFDAHQPYEPPHPFDTMFGSGGPMPDLATRPTWGKKEIQRSIDAYDGAIAYVDQEVERLLGGLRSRQLLANTLIVITSDHGEQFGEHGLYGHANSLYRQTLEVPLVISFPSRVPAGLRVAGPVSLADLPATILDLTRARNGQAFPGRSLAWHWSPAPLAAQPSPLFAETSRGLNQPEGLPISKGRVRSMVVDGVHYIRNGDGREELYDFEHDRAETQSLIGRPGHEQKLEAARRAISAIVSRSVEPASAPSASLRPPRRSR